MNLTVINATHVLWSFIGQQRFCCYWFTHVWLLRCNVSFSYLVSKTKSMLPTHSYWTSQCISPCTLLAEEELFSLTVIVIEAMSTWKRPLYDQKKSHLDWPLKPARACQLMTALMSHRMMLHRLETLRICQNDHSYNSKTTTSNAVQSSTTQQPAVQLLQLIAYFQQVAQTPHAI